MSEMSQTDQQVLIGAVIFVVAMIVTGLIFRSDSKKETK